MSRLLIALLMFAVTFALSACQSGEEEEATKAAVAPVVLHAPATSDDKEWKLYLQQVVSQNMAGITDRVYPYYLPANSTTPTPGDAENRSQYDRQLENVTGVIFRTMLPGNTVRETTVLTFSSWRSYLLRPSASSAPGTVLSAGR